MLSTLTLLLLISTITLMNTQVVNCNYWDWDCKCPNRPQYRGTACTINCDKEYSCSGRTLTCRSNDPCTINCIGKSSCSGTIIQADLATDVTIKCAATDACKDMSQIICGTQTCVLQCPNPSTTCENFGNINVDNAQSFQCIGDYCPNNIPDSFTLSPTNNPIIPTHSTKIPSNYPTFAPIPQPTNTPSKTPISAPTSNPSTFITVHPSKTPTETPSNSPIIAPTSNPSLFTSKTPTETPITFSAKSPSQFITVHPSHMPTQMPEIITVHQTLHSTNNNVWMYVVIVMSILFFGVCIMMPIYIRKYNKKKKFIRDNFDNNNNNINMDQVTPNSRSIQMVTPQNDGDIWANPLYKGHTKKESMGNDIVVKSDSEQSYEAHNGTKGEMHLAVPQSMILAAMTKALPMTPNDTNFFANEGIITGSVGSPSADFGSVLYAPGIGVVTPGSVGSPSADFGSVLYAPGIGVVTPGGDIDNGQFAE